MNVARFNFSHGTHEEHAFRLKAIREAARKTGKNVSIMLDTKGPEIRLGYLERERITLETGKKVNLTVDNVRGNERVLPVTYPGLPRDVFPGDRILIADGLIELRVLDKTRKKVECEIVNGGEITSQKGINLPGVRISEPSLTRKDKVDVRFAVKLGVDYLAMSFVRRPDDIERLKRMLKRLGADIPVIAKIEKPEALENITAILAGADGIMVARGDLGVEMPPEKVPQIQKDLIAQCIESGKPVITATQMLESMITSARPTRAEASDVANAIYDGTGAVMLSGETAVGEYPVQAVRMMARIADEADAHVGKKQGKVFRHAETIDSFEDAIGQATETTARHLPTRLIVCFTSSGFTAQQVSSYRPKVPIVAATHNREVLPRMSLYWGVQPICIKRVETVDAMIIRVERELLDHRMAHKGDTIIITAGYPLGVRGTTNMMQLVRVGEHRRSATAGRDAGKRG
jgi:pyruvate kinase